MANIYHFFNGKILFLLSLLKFTISNAYGHSMDDMDKMCDEQFWFTTKTIAHHFYEECPKYQGHKGDPGVTPGTKGAVGERAK